MAGGPYGVDGNPTPRPPSTWIAFVVVLGLATVVDHAPFPRKLLDSWFEGALRGDPFQAWVRTIWMMAALWAVVRPSAVGRYLLLCAVGSIAIVSQLPRVPNHWILELGVYAGSLVTAALVRDDRERFECFRALIWGALLAVYAWTFIHKLNTGFLDPATSCGPTFVDSLTSRLRIPRVGEELRATAVGAVLVAEGAMPLLLLTARGRALAIVLGIGLHAMFGLFVAGFSLLVWATYFMLLPPTALDTTVARVRRAATATRKRFASTTSIRSGVKQGVSLLVIAALALLIKEVPRFRGLTQQETLLLPIAVIVGTLLLRGVAASHWKIEMRWPRGRNLAVALFLPVLLLANGFTPYLGIRNTLSFSMFSNLRTENGESNHLFLPSIVTPESVLDDQVRVVASSDDVLARYSRPLRRNRWNWTALIAEGQRARFEIPFFMVRYRAQELRGLDESMFSITLEREGTTLVLTPDEVSSLPPVSRLASWIHWSKGTPLPPDEAACMW